MKHLQDASKELMGHLLFALNHSLDLKRDGVDPMIPFAVVIRGADKGLKTFVGDTPDDADYMFEKTIQEECPDFVVYATDSYLTVDGTRYDAVLLKAYDKNDPEVYLVSQKFIPKTTTTEFKQLGNPGFLGTIKNPHYTPPAQSKESKKPWWKVWRK